MDYTGKHIVCVDDSPASRVALNFACKKASKRGGIVEMLHVIPPADMQNMFGMLEKAREEQRLEADKLMAGLLKSAQEYSGVTPLVQVREGRLGDEILNAVMEDQSIDMVMLGASAASAEGDKLIQWLVSTMSDKLLVPVMLVPGNLTDLQIEALS